MSEETKDNVYDEDIVEEQLEDDELTSEEAAFMEGYDEGKAVIKCASCGHLVDLDSAIEEKSNGENLRFCSTNCAESFEKKQKEEE